MKKPMFLTYKIIAVLTGLFLFVSMDVFGQQSGFGIMPEKRYLWFTNTDRTLTETAKPVVQVPPTCGKKRRAAGNDLALPFGTTAAFSINRQYYDADDLMLSNDSNDIVVVGNASVQNSTSGNMRFVFRPDVWVLPILNVYGLFGYAQSNTQPDFTVPEVTVKNLPLIGEITLDTAVTIKEELVFYAPVYGGGATLSAGYGFFFFLLDYNYSVTKPDGTEDKLECHAFSGKLGILLGNNSKKTKASVYTGVGYINDDHTFKGEVDTKDILPELVAVFGEKAVYTGTVHAKQYWNLVLGTSLMVNKHHFVVVEFGFYQREQAMVSYGYRF